MLLLTQLLGKGAQGWLTAELPGSSLDSIHQGPSEAELKGQRENWLAQVFLGSLPGLRPRPRLWVYRELPEGCG